ncbi:myosin-binding protein 7 [Salvia miltiorrhiza]|uniref:myosin-binding protein 7 n=1 Tax=Salvia miltiorrhiza TaxID=226208 RepID=UPI0025ABCBD4|nr:myosin-binding protein 7 [Salvia miltiorrhiza]
MELDDSLQSMSHVQCCDCGCSCSMTNTASSEACLRSVKRKYDDVKEENKFTVPGLVVPQNARVEVENECMALRETVSSQQQTIQDLIMELEEERNASSSAANEAMSMILRLQREKAEVHMEARQFKRFAEGKMAHDQQEALALEDLLYKREQTIHSLTCEVQAYKHRMMSFGLTESEADGEKVASQNTSMTENLEGQYEFPAYEMYPPLKCNINESQAYPDGDDETADIEKYPFGETPRSRYELKDFEYRLNELEQSPRTIEPDLEYFGTKNMLEKVTVGQSPRRPKHLRKLSTDSSNSQFSMIKEMGQDFATDSPKCGGSFKKTVFSHLDLNPNFRKVDNASEVGDDVNDRVYTIDSIHQGSAVNGVMDHKASVGSLYDDYTKSPRESLEHSDVMDLEMQKLYARLQALEADRESMRQALISVGTDKAQLVLLKEIAENLCKEMAPAKPMPIQKKPATKSLSFISLFKWVVSFVFWRRKARRSRYMFGKSAKNEGLLMLLDRGPRVGQRRVVSTVNLRN